MWFEVIMKNLILEIGDPNLKGIGRSAYYTAY